MQPWLAWSSLYRTAGLRFTEILLLLPSTCWVKGVCHHAPKDKYLRFHLCKVPRIGHSTEAERGSWGGNRRQCHIGTDFMLKNDENIEKREKWEMHTDRWLMINSMLCVFTMLKGKGTYVLSCSHLVGFLSCLCPQLHLLFTSLLKLHD